MPVSWEAFFKSCVRGVSPLDVLSVGCPASTPDAVDATVLPGASCNHLICTRDLLAIVAVICRDLLFTWCYDLLLVIVACC